VAEIHYNNQNGAAKHLKKNAF